MSAAAFCLPEPSALPAARRQGRVNIRGFGIQAVDRLLPGTGLQHGTVTEIRATGAACGATSLALRACRAAQGERRGQWCAFIDPSQTLFAPGVARHGIDLERLLVVRPRWGEVESVAACIAESRVAAVMVLDLRVGSPAPALHPAHDSGLPARLAMTVEGTGLSVLLLTRGERADDPLPIGMTLRLMLTRASEHELQLRVTERGQRAKAPKVIPWALLSSDSDSRGEQRV